MQGYILLKKSQAAWDERDGLRMLTLAQAARGGPWQLPPLIQAEVAQQEARGLAMTGESSATVDAKLNEAWEIFTAADATMSELGWHYDRLTARVTSFSVTPNGPSRSLRPLQKRYVPATRHAH